MPSSNSTLAKGSRETVALRHRINAGRVAVLNQRDFFKSQFGNLPCEWKEDDTRVTFADFAISEKLFAELRGSFPADDYCSEEGNPADETQALEAEFAWVLDPIDGTNNYYLGIPFCAISLALLRRGQPVYGFIYDYSRDRLVQGGPGFGLLDGTSRASVSQSPPDPRKSVAGMSFPMTAGDLRRLGPWLESSRLRVTGSAALNLTYTALGKLDGCLDFKAKVWDIAAGVALVEGGGGEYHFQGENPFPLTRFHPAMPPVRYWAGGSAFCQWIHGKLAGENAG